MRKCAKCGIRETIVFKKSDNSYCAECRRILNQEARERQKNPRKCGFCSNEMRDRENSRRGFCSEECELNGRHKKKKDGCWNWTGPKQNMGYGYICRERKKILAHRVSFRIYEHDIDDKVVIRHKCNNPICINPNHLEEGKQWDNIQDALKVGHIPRKLNWEKVCEIRERHLKGENYAQLGKYFEVDAKTISDIVNWKKWKRKPNET